MRVVEKFVSINGEGLRSGELAVFIRFANCNLRCSYCDTKYSFINPIYTEESIDELVKYVKSTGVKKRYFNWWRTIDSKRNKRTNDRTIKYWKQN